MMVTGAHKRMSRRFVIRYTDVFRWLAVVSDSTAVKSVIKPIQHVLYKASRYVSLFIGWNKWYKLAKSAKIPTDNNEITPQNNLI